MQIVEEKNMADRDGVKYMIRGPNIDWGVITLQPEQEMSAHFHEEVEETFYILEGTTTFILKEKNFDASAGTALRLEPSESHGLKNNTEHITKMVFIKHVYRPKDKISC